MEQTNVVVTPDGKTWDEVTRDVSYIGNACLYAHTDSAFGGAVIVSDEWRGTTGDLTGGNIYFNKDFAIAYDRMICLRDGDYFLNWSFFQSSISLGTGSTIRINGTTGWSQNNTLHPNDHKEQIHGTAHLIRGDYIQLYGTQTASTAVWNRFQINRV